MPILNKKAFSLLFSLWFLLSFALYGQKVSPMFYKEIQLNHKPYTLQSITLEMQAQSGINFSYNAAKINSSQKIRLKGDRITVAEILTLIQKKTGIHYRTISPTHIVYVVSGSASSKIKRTKKDKKVKPAGREKYYDTEKENNESTLVASKPLLATDTAQIVIIGDSSALKDYTIGGGFGGGSSGGGYVAEKEIHFIEPQKTWQDPYGNLSPKSLIHLGGLGKGFSSGSSEALGFMKTNTLLAIGLASDELYYINPTAKIGFDFLYGIVSYNKGSYSHWRYGIGVSGKISERWNLSLEATTGQTILRNFDIQNADTTIVVGPDSVNVPVISITHTPLQVREKLNRLSLGTQYYLGSGFYLGGAMNINMLKTSYYSNGNPVHLSDILPIGYDADKKYQSIKAPYLLGNSYTGSQPSNTKVWVGIQISLMYRLRFWEE